MKTKRYSILLAGLVLILATSVLACNQPATPTQTTSAPSASPPEPAVIQPTPRTLVQTYVVNSYPAETLTIPLKAGERVEVEVAPSVTSTTLFLSTLTDPFGNIIAKSASRPATPIEEASESIKAGQVLSTQKYPWRFAFIAATDGDYILKVTIGRFHSVGTIIPSATTGSYTLKAIIYP